MTTSSITSKGQVTVLANRSVTDPKGMFDKATRTVQIEEMSRIIAAPGLKAW